MPTAGLRQRLQRDCIRFFLRETTGTSSGRVRIIKSTIGELLVTEKQAQKFKLDAHQKINPYISTFVLSSLDELPITLIKARIAAGMTQKELAEKIGVREQQIQRYEATHYNAASFERLRSIANTLNIEITQAVMQVHF